MVVVVGVGDAGGKSLLETKKGLGEEARVLEKSLKTRMTRMTRIQMMGR